MAISSIKQEVMIKHSECGKYCDSSCSFLTEKSYEVNGGYENTYEYPFCNLCNDWIRVDFGDDDYVFAEFLRLDECFNKESRGVVSE